MSETDRGPGETQWVCARCGIALTPARVQVSYLGSAFTVVLPVCAKCGTALVDEDVAMNKIAQAEKVLEDK